MPNDGIAACMRLNAKLTKQRDDLYTALEELLKAGQHEGPCDNQDPQTGEWYDGAGACDLHLAASEARRVKARAALLKANPNRTEPVA